MTLFLLVGVPIAAGLATWCAGDRRTMLRAACVTAGLIGALTMAIIATVRAPSADVRWGPGLTLSFEVADIARAPIVLVPVVASAVVVYALDYGAVRGRSRMVGLLLTFVGAMELLLVAGDLLSLIIAWELVGVISWGLIAHHWRTDGPGNAAHAFLVTRAGDLGLFLAAGAAFAIAGSLRFSDLGDLGGQHGWAPHAMVAGVLLAAFAKSAQLPFSPWLFSAMAGPTPASALLHSATMVAAGVYLVARLSPVLSTVGWFSPVAVGVGLATALAGGVVAALQPEPKKLLAASTSAHYGFMFVAVGAGFPAVAIAHMVAHGLFKALLFVSAGVAIDASGSTRFESMQLGGRYRAISVLTAVGALALAAVPPLGAAWTKEEVVSAGSDDAVWIGVLVIVAGACSALYATRFQLLTFGSHDQSEHAGDHAGFGHARVALAVLAAGSLALSVLWLPWGSTLVADITGGSFPPSAPWEFIASVTAVAAGVATAVELRRRRRLLVPVSGAVALADWFGISRVTRLGIVDPVLALARRLATFDDRVVDAGVRGAGALATHAGTAFATFDDRVVDAGIRLATHLAQRSSRLLDRSGEFAVDRAVRGVAGGVSALGRRSRRIQSGQAHQYYALVAVTAIVLTVALTVALTVRR